MHCVRMLQMSVWNRETFATILRGVETQRSMPSDQWRAFNAGVRCRRPTVGASTPLEQSSREELHLRKPAISDRHGHPILGNSGIKFEVEGGEGSPGADTYIPPPKKLQSCFIYHRNLRLIFLQHFLKISEKCCKIAIFFEK